jgi:hypothetical protein
MSIIGVRQSRQTIVYNPPRRIALFGQYVMHAGWVATDLFNIIGAILLLSP